MFPGKSMGGGVSDGGQTTISGFWEVEREAVKDFFENYLVIPLQFCHSLNTASWVQRWCCSGSSARPIYGGFIPRRGLPGSSPGPGNICHMSSPVFLMGVKRQSNICQK
ncbi:hypothetical protein CHARACLAT_026392 [Characodon lateralis]|uniref:Uncharacterized protein n=1 Tax=Characodon lateralis TaxID=208331 RepID=A0ABU7EMF8_9TELE|nr:hypothetical protein [Characodon lateralis]